MNKLLALLEGDHNRAQAEMIAEAVLKGDIALEDLMSCFFSDDIRLSQRASWPLSVIADENSALIRPFTGPMLENLKRPVHNAIIRNSMRIWQDMDLRKEFQGEIFERAFDYLTDPQYPPAIRVFAMTVCANLSRNFPDLAEELIHVIEDHYPHGTAGFKSRAKKELKKLRAISK